LSYHLFAIIYETLKLYVLHFHRCWLVLLAKELFIVPPVFLLIQWFIDLRNIFLISLFLCSVWLLCCNSFSNILIGVLTRFHDRANWLAFVTISVWSFFYFLFWSLFFTLNWIKLKRFYLSTVILLICCSSTVSGERRSFNTSNSLICFRITHWYLSESCKYFSLLILKSLIMEGRVKQSILTALFHTYLIWNSYWWNLLTRVISWLCCIWGLPVLLRQPILLGSDWIWNFFFVVCLKFRRATNFWVVGCGALQVWILGCWLNCIPLVFQEISLSFVYWTNEYFTARGTFIDDFVISCSCGKLFQDRRSFMSATSRSIEFSTLKWL